MQIGKWYNQGKPEDYMSTDKDIFSINDVPCGFIYKFVLLVINKYNDASIYSIAERKYIGNRWCWLIDDKVFKDDMICAWFAIPMVEYD